MNPDSQFVFSPEFLQSKATGVVVDFTEPSNVYDNVKQVNSLAEPDTVAALSAFCEKASTVSTG